MRARNEHEHEHEHEREREMGSQRVEVVVEGVREVVHATPSMTLQQVLEKATEKARVDAELCSLRVQSSKQMMKPETMRLPLRYAGVTNTRLVVVVTNGGAERGLPKKAKPETKRDTDLKEKEDEGEEAKEEKGRGGETMEKLMREQREKEQRERTEQQQKKLEQQEKLEKRRKEQALARATIMAQQRYEHANEVRVFSADAFKPRMNTNSDAEGTSNTSKMTGSGDAATTQPGDDFYEFTIEDYARLERARKAREGKDRGRALMTKKLRDEEDQRRMAALPPVVIRLVLPDGVMVETTFDAADPVRRLFLFVRGCMVRRLARPSSIRSRDDTARLARNTHTQLARLCAYSVCEWRDIWAMRVAINDSVKC